MAGQFWEGVITKKVTMVTVGIKIINQTQKLMDKQRASISILFNSVRTKLTHNWVVKLQPQSIGKGIVVLCP